LIISVWTAANPVKFSFQVRRISHNACPVAATTWKNFFPHLPPCPGLQKTAYRGRGTPAVADQPRAMAIVPGRVVVAEGTEET